MRPDLADFVWALRGTPLRQWLVILLAGFCLANCAGPLGQHKVYDSEAASRSYERIAHFLQQNGHLKTVVEPARSQITATQLARNFEMIAFYSEYSLDKGRYVANRDNLRLQRWEVPLRATLVFGQSVPIGKQGALRARVARYLERLQAITGHSIQLANQDPNVLIMILSTEEVHQARRLIRRFSKRIPPNIAQSIATSPPTILCSAYTIAPSEAVPSLAAGVVLIRSEHKGIMLEACIHEELAQALGLPNDRDSVAPSIFNDNEEYALLTGHDENLLRILYDPRLQVGMTRTEARPIIHAIAREIMAESSGPQSDALRVHPHRSP